MRTLISAKNTKRPVTGMTVVRAVPIVRQEDMTCFFIGMEFLVEHPTLGHGMRLAFPYARLLEMDEQTFRAALHAPPEQREPALPEPEPPKLLKKRSSKQLQPD